MKTVPRWTTCSVLLLASLIGCGKSDGPELASVNGKVTLGGKPLPDANIQFVPELGRLSTAITKADGKYQLQYSAKQEGAIVGNHLVRVSTFRKASEDSEQTAAPETVPAKYNAKSKLKHEVKPGKNEINLDLEAIGEIIQPDKANAQRQNRNSDDE